IANSNLSVATNDVDDASRDLTEAGGNQRERIEQMKRSHEEADKSRKNPDEIFPQAATEKLGLVHGFEQWSALRNKKELLKRAKSEADSLVASLAEQHDALAAQIDAEKFNSPDLAAHSKLADAPSTESRVSTITESVRKARSASERKAVLATS